MKFRRLRKAAAIIGVVVIITLVGYTFSVAQDTTPAFNGHWPGFYRGLTAEASPQDDFDAPVGIISKPGLFSPELYTIGKAPPIHRAHPCRTEFPARHAKARKIALHLFQSVLLN
jgi:hypothetical protein